MANIIEQTEILTSLASVKQELRDEGISIAIEVSQGEYEWCKPFVNRPARILTDGITEVQLEDGRLVRADTCDLDIEENN